MVVHVISIQGLWGQDLLQISGEFLLPQSVSLAYMQLLELTVDLLQS